jgi:hypothetical protein
MDLSQSVTCRAFRVPCAWERDGGPRDHDNERRRRALTGTPSFVVTLADFTGPQLGVRLSLSDFGGEPNGRHGLAVATAFSEEGRFRLPVQEVFPLAQAARAHAFAERGSRRGKLVLTVPPAERS